MLLYVFSFVWHLQSIFILLVLGCLLHVAPFLTHRLPVHLSCLSVMHGIYLLVKYLHKVGNSKIYKALIHPQKQTRGKIGCRLRALPPRLVDQASECWVRLKGWIALFFDCRCSFYKAPFRRSKAWLAIVKRVKWRISYVHWLAFFLLSFLTQLSFLWMEVGGIWPILGYWCSLGSGAGEQLHLRGWTRLEINPHDTGNWSDWRCGMADARRAVAELDTIPHLSHPCKRVQWWVGWWLHVLRFG